MIGEVTPREPVVGKGRFQWNAGGWFGSVIGASLWMLVCSFVLWPHSAKLGVIWLTGFLAINFAGIGLYACRFRLKPYPAIQWLMLVCAVASFGAWTALVILRPDLLPRLHATAWGGYLALLIIPGLMFRFHHMESTPAKIISMRELEEESQHDT